MNKGILYGVGVGPGDPDLMTLKAVKTIGRCRVVAAPRTRGGAMVALDIARGALELSEKTILPLDFAMCRDADVRAESHRAAADAIRPHLDAGESVAMLNLGDVSIYASFRYVADVISAGGYAVEMVPGVTSFCAAAAALGVSLTDMDTPIHILPDGGDPGRAVAPGSTAIWMKSGKSLRPLLRRLGDAGVLGETLAVRNCGLPGQKIYRGLDGVDIEDGYFTVVIRKNCGGEAER